MGDACSMMAADHFVVHFEKMNSFNLVDPNDLLNSVLSSTEGEFLVKGGEDEFGSIEPFLRITHTCNVKKPGCKRVSEYEIPKSKINGVYDMTFVTLDIHSAVDSEKCK
ncbi:Transthyretin-like family protein [Dictyocaulus viviparus]|uniref:Transthyretin-like family protein n=1 Tax=Dictyocaulus viviparus TaxID=29172 RepID=A0A0D8XU18_DICVI|nr:Transthyretin-like family protein [Dictyocaulus viviparus]